MKQLNRICIQGYLVRDPEYLVFPGDKSTTHICNMYIANNNVYVHAGVASEETVFFECRVLGKNAINCKDLLVRGSEVIIEGRLTLDQWTSANGTRRQKLKVVGDNVIFMSKGDNNSASFAGIED